MTVETSHGPKIAIFGLSRSDRGLLLVRFPPDQARRSRPRGRQSGFPMDPLRDSHHNSSIPLAGLRWSKITDALEPDSPLGPVGR